MRQQLAVAYEGVLESCYRTTNQSVKRWLVETAIALKNAHTDNHFKEGEHTPNSSSSDLTHFLDEDRRVPSVSFLEPKEPPSSTASRGNTRSPAQAQPNINVTGQSPQDDSGIVLISPACLPAGSQPAVVTLRFPQTGCWSSEGGTTDGNSSSLRASSGGDGSSICFVGMNGPSQGAPVSDCSADHHIRHPSPPHPMSACSAEPDKPISVTRLMALSNGNVVSDFELSSASGAEPGSLPREVKCELVPGEQTGAVLFLLSGRSQTVAAPLLVLPPCAAVEVQQLFDTMLKVMQHQLLGVGERMGYNVGECEQQPAAISPDLHSAVWLHHFRPFACDLRIILEASTVIPLKDADGPPAAPWMPESVHTNPHLSAGAAPLPAAVLQTLVPFLHGQGMWHTLTLVLKSAARAGLGLPSPCPVPGPLASSPSAPWPASFAGVQPLSHAKAPVPTVPLLAPGGNRGCKSEAAMLPTFSPDARAVVHTPWGRSPSAAVARLGASFTAQVLAPVAKPCASAGLARAVPTAILSHPLHCLAHSCSAVASVDPFAQLRAPRMHMSPVPLLGLGPGWVPGFSPVVALDDSVGVPHGASHGSITGASPGDYWHAAAACNSPQAWPPAGLLPQQEHCCIRCPRCCGCISDNDISALGMRPAKRSRGCSLSPSRSASPSPSASSSPPPSACPSANSQSTCPTECSASSAASHRPLRQRHATRDCVMRGGIAKRGRARMQPCHTAS